MNRKKKPIMRGAGGTLLTCALAAGGMFLGVPMASAATTDIVVSNLSLSGAGSLRAALEQANASTDADGVAITFDESLQGAGQLTFPNGGSADFMTTDNLATTGGESAGVLGPGGARFLIDSQVPVSIDFANLDGINDNVDSSAAGIYVKSDDVTISNLAQLRAGETGIAIGGTGTTVSNVKVSDTETNWTEVGIGLLDGAADTTITDATLESAQWSNVLVESNGTVTDTKISGLDSRGAESWAHISIEDGATVDGFSVADSHLGAPGEISPQPAYYMNPGITVSNFSLTDSTFESPNRQVFHVPGSGQTFTGLTVTGNTFGGNEDAPIGDIIDANSASWTDVAFRDNTVSYAGRIDLRGEVKNLDFTDNDFTSTNFVNFRGAVSDARFDGNTFTHLDQIGSAPALGFLAGATNVDVTDNAWDRTYAIETIQVDGGTATDVNISGNTLKNINAAISTAAVYIGAPGTGNVVSGNTITQNNSDEGMRADAFNHWAVFSVANAESAEQQTGWSIVDNAIDGFGWNYLAASGQEAANGTEAPIRVAGIGKLPVTGNTFGQHTHGTVEAVSENGGNWFLWNVRGDSNGKVQTYRADRVAYTGEKALFTAIAPEPEAGNNPAVEGEGVTLHVYWTADDNAEEYLGSLDGVRAGERVSIPTDHTDGVIRVQTVDANGNASQYSSIAEEAPVVVTSPVVEETTDEEVTGTSQPDAHLIVRDEDDNDVANADADEDGSWTVPMSELACGTTYTIVQVVDEDESAPVEFTTADCPVEPVTEPTVGDVTDDGVTGTADPDNTIELRDENDDVVDEVTVGEDGTWSFTGLTCGTDYAVVQVSAEGESDAVPFTTAACDDGETDGSDGDGTDGDGTDGDATDGTGSGGDGSGGDGVDGADGGSSDGTDAGSDSADESNSDDELAVTGAAGLGAAGLGAAALLAIGGGILWIRRRTQRA